MEDEELKSLWQNNMEEININSQQILLEMNLEIQEAEESINKRNMIEIMACIFLIIFFSVKFFLYVFLIQKIGAALAVLGAIFIIYKLLSVKNLQKKADLFNDAKSQMIADKKYLQKEQKLLKNVLYWYILPIFIPIILIMMPRSFTGFDVITYSLILLIVCYSCYYTYKINQKAAKKFDPILDSLDMAIKELEE